MGESRTFSHSARASLEEHRQVHFYLDQIALALEAMGAGRSDAQRMRQLAAHVEALRERLAEHHDAEERRGLFDAVLDVLPESRAQVDRLLDEHERMIEILELARIHAQRGEPSEADALRDDLEEFLEVFRRHEEDEERLLRRAIERERRAPGQS